MRKNAAVIWNVTGQQLELRFAPGRPTSATWAVYRAYGSDDATAEFSGAAVLDTVNTTASAVAGRSQSDPQRIPLTSTAGILARREYVFGAAGLQEQVQIIEVGTGYVRVRYPLQNDYASGEPFVGTTITAAVDDAWAANRGKLSDLSDTYPDYRVRWSVVFAGATVVVYSFFDLVRSAITHDVTIGDINDRAPGLFDGLPVEYQTENGRPLVDAAWKYVRAHLIATGIDPASIRDSEAIDEMVVRAALRILAEGGWHPKGFDAREYVDIVSDRYDRYFETHFAVVIKPRLDLQVGVAQSAGELPIRSTRFAVK